MDFEIANKTAIVAAASQGLGFAAALDLAREGVKLAICSRNRDNIEAAARRIRQEAGAEVLAAVADVRKPKDLENLIRQTHDAFHSIDILVTNAGGPPAGLFADISDEGWHAGVELTMMSTIRLIRGVLPFMQQKKWGRIVNILSISVKQPITGLLVSNTLRPGLVGLAKSLADEIAGDGITINNVCPGWTKTERVEELMQARANKQGITPKQASENIIANIPMQRMAEPKELAALIAFLCSARASYLTGTTIPVDGGAYRGLM